MSKRRPDSTTEAIAPFDAGKRNLPAWIVERGRRYAQTGKVRKQNPPSPSPNRHQLAFLTVPEAAKVLRVCEKTVLRQIRLGQIPSIRVGRCLRIPASAFFDAPALPEPTWPEVGE